MRERNCPKGCGECCKVVTMTNQSKAKWRKKDWFWAIKNLKQIRKKDAIKLSPILKDNGWKDIKYYKCRFLDYKKKVCTDYTNRPDMCRNFPHYEKTVLDASKMITLPDCYYKHQIMKAG